MFVKNKFVTNMFFRAWTHLAVGSRPGPFRKYLDLNGAWDQPGQNMCSIRMAG
jgi:hypothetical protein